MTVWNYLKDVLFRPEYYFKTYSLQSDRSKSNRSIRDFLIVLFCLAVILTSTRVLHESLFAPIKIKVAQEASAKVEENRKNYAQDRGFVFTLLSKVIYVLIWILIPILLALIRLPILYFIGEHKVGFKQFFITTLATSLPLLFSSFIISAGYDLISLDYTMEIVDFLKLFLSILLLGWIWEGRLCYHAFTGQYDQNNGRAILIWLTPSLLFMNAFSVKFLIQIWFG
ncbi:YIP1 family protein [Leptospira weilii]|uniref:Yip1 domain protein n=2 Tax=Leptospira weilii TaxID=28184 RepID=N1U514_9LEPT|nr:YIP1 family protein [Leptospira weilii]EMM74264.1 Yip1 domain protein [Leptospira weilii str. 2006001855]EMY15568.1 Yip1 domain protein [Leptospira weilii str. Ecochallenge]MCL8268132.1 YIP1 family protein [Leptospira weilii]